MAKLKESQKSSKKGPVIVSSKNKEIPKKQNKSLKTEKTANQKKGKLAVQNIQKEEVLPKTMDSRKIIEVISDLVGEEVIDLVIELITQSDYSEFKLAEKLNQDVNSTRNMLYRLLEHNLVYFSRRKDKRKGWYIYYWTFNPNDIEQKRLSILEKKIEVLDVKLNNDYSHDIFFMCQNKCERYDFDFAAEHEFKCQECGELLEQHDNVECRHQTMQRISELKQELIESRN